MKAWILSALLLSACAGPTGATPNFHELVPGQIDRLAQMNQAGMHELAVRGIHTVIKLNTEKLAEERTWAKAEGIRLIEKPLPGFGDPPEADENAIQAMLLDSELWPIAFQCLHGSDRTGLVAALYRVNVQGWTPEAAFEEWMKYGHTPLVGMDSYFWAHVKR